MEESPADGQVKLIIPLEKDEDDYPPVEFEELWSTPVGDGLFRLENIPFFARGLARGDVVSAVEEEQVLRIQEVVESSGHSTIRLLVSDANAVPAVIERFEHLGCDTEVTFGKLVALDVPPSVSLDEVREKLDLGDAQSQWEYEEACISEPADTSQGEEESQS